MPIAEQKMSASEVLILNAQICAVSGNLLALTAGGATVTPAQDGASGAAPR